MQHEILHLIFIHLTIIILIVLALVNYNNSTKLLLFKILDLSLNISTDFMRSSQGSDKVVDAAHWWWLRRDPPHMIVKRFGCTAIHKKALYKCIIHSFIQW